MAPAVFMGNSQDAIFQISQWADNVEDLFHLFGIYEFLPHDELLAELGKKVFFITLQNEYLSCPTDVTQIANLRGLGCSLT